jgi:5-hydroxyisourate hydrolase-like protein (transthyretin family)
MRPIPALCALAAVLLAAAGLFWLCRGTSDPALPGAVEGSRSVGGATAIDAPAASDSRSAVATTDPTPAAARTPFLDAATATVVVRADAGDPVVDAEVRLWREESEGVLTPEPPTGAATLRTDAEGRCRFPSLDPETRYLGEVRATQWRRCAFGLETPLRGAESRTEVRLPAPPPMLVGRLLAADGRPEAHAVFAFALRLADGNTESFDLERTDAEGRFLWPLAREAVGVTALECSFRLGRPYGPEMRTALVAVGRTVVAGTNDVGDVVCTPAPLTVAGRVVDEADAPFASAWVFLVDPTDEGEQAVAEGGGRAWKFPLPPVEARTDAAGAFAFHGAAGAGARAVFVLTAAAGPSAAEPFAVGERDLRVVVPRGDGLAGTVLLDDPSCAERVRFALRRAGTGETLNARAAVDADGAFTLTGIAAGAATLTASCDGVERTVDGLQVVAGATTRDDRLLEIDLRAGRKYVALTVVDAASRPVAGVRVCPIVGAENAVGPETGADGRVRCAVPPEGGSFLLYEGHAHETPYRTKRVDGVSGDLTVVVEPGPAVRPALDAAVRIPPGARVDVRLVPHDAVAADGVTRLDRLYPSFGFSPGFGTFAPSGEFRVPGPGRYRALCTCVAPSARAVGLRGVDLVVDVADRPGAAPPQVFVLRPPQAALDAAIAEAGG